MKKNSLLIGAAVSGMILASGCATKSATDSLTADQRAKVGECHGINSCKGQGDCGGPGYSCAGKNACKGKGWLKMSQGDCLDKKGTFKEG